MSKPQKRWPEMMVAYIHSDDSPRSEEQCKRILEMIQIEEEQINVLPASEAASLNVNSTDSLIFGGLAAYPEGVRNDSAPWETILGKNIPVWAFEAGVAVLLSEPETLKRLDTPEILRIRLTNEGKKDTIFSTMDDLFYSACYFEPFTLFNRDCGIPLAETHNGQVVAFRKPDQHVYGTLFHPHRYKSLVYRFFRKFVAQPELLA
ncbi:MAG TPA: hypothetical protein VKA08_09790 [Balneolales bacterium]|nr:hypothetical protein [Balneolales bacterium]